MDALPIPEDSGEEFSSEVPGKMHGCGHDMHTAMLLGAAKLLKAHEDELEGTVKLEFQPAEEIFQGSPDMIASGLLEDPHVDAAVMFHVLAGMPLPVGTVLVPGGGITMASCEQYHIAVSYTHLLEPQLQQWRRTLHRHPEVGFDLPHTKELVKKALTEMGLSLIHIFGVGSLTMAVGLDEQQLHGCRQSLLGLFGVQQLLAEVLLAHLGLCHIRCV